MGKSGKVRHLELDGPEWIESHINCQEWFTRGGWDSFISKFNRSSYQVARAFSESFDGQFVQVCDLNVQFTKDFTAIATNLPADGERWFKN